MFQCIKICNDLNIQNGSNSMVELFEQIETKIQSKNIIMNGSAGGSGGRTSSELLLPLQLKSNLNANQLALLHTIHESIFQDFYKRRKMMLTRVDVTIESFMWGENVIGREGEIVATIQTQRKELHEIPFKYTVSVQHISIYVCICMYALSMGCMFRYIYILSLLVSLIYTSTSTYICTYLLLTLSISLYM